MEADGRKEKEIEKEKALNKRVCVCVCVRVVSIFKLYCDVYYILLPQMELSRSHILPPSYIGRAYNGKW